MKDSKQLVERAARGIAASSRTSATPPGQTERGDSHSALDTQTTQATQTTQNAQRGRATPERVEAINQVFALFRLNYHNQYYSAFPDASQLNQIKKLWLDALADYPVAQILQGARHAIENSEYLPTLHRMLQSCRACYADYGLPPAQEAYLEACGAPSPKAAQRWSHPAVYYAGRDSDWFLLANRPERDSWPVFNRHYAQYCQRVIAGEELAPPQGPALEQSPGTPMSLEQQQAALKALREEVGL